MATKLLIQNLCSSMNINELSVMFSGVGDVKSAKIEIITGPNGDRHLGRVEMANASQAADCIELLNGFEKNGLKLIVREDKPHTPNPDYKYVRPTVATAKSKKKEKPKVRLT